MATVTEVLAHHDILSLETPPYPCQGNDQPPHVVEGCGNTAHCLLNESTREAITSNSLPGLLNRGWLYVAVSGTPLTCAEEPRSAWLLLSRDPVDRQTAGEGEAYSCWRWRAVQMWERRQGGGVQLLYGLDPGSTRGCHSYSKSCVPWVSAKMAGYPVYSRVVVCVNIFFFRELPPPPATLLCLLLSSRNP